MDYLLSFLIVLIPTTATTIQLKHWQQIYRYVEQHFPDEWARCGAQRYGMKQEKARRLFIQGSLESGPLSQVKDAGFTRLTQRKEKLEKISSIAFALALGILLIRAFLS